MSLLFSPLNCLVYEMSNNRAQGEFSKPNTYDDDSSSSSSSSSKK